MRYWTHIRRILLSIIFLSCLSSFAQAEDGKTVIYGYMLKNRLESETTGPYAHFMQELLRNTSEQFVFQAVPLERGIRDFWQDLDSCVMPAAIEALELVMPEGKYVRLRESMPIDYVSRHVFTAPHTAPVTDLSQLEGKSISAMLGVGTREFMKGINYDLFEVRQEVQGIRMLLAGRIDAFIGHIPDVPIALKKIDPSIELSYAADHPLISTATHIVCHDFPGVEIILATLNHRLANMKGAGKDRILLGKHAILSAPRNLTRKEIN